MCKSLLLFAAVVLSLAFAPVPFPKPDPTKVELKKLQGQWVKDRSVIAGGPEMPDGMSTLVFTGDRMNYTQAGTPVGEYTLTIDARKKPKLFDFIGVGGFAKGSTYRGIYRLEGDTLTICYRTSELQSDRPTDFDTSKVAVNLSIYKRRKP